MFESEHARARAFNMGDTFETELLHHLSDVGLHVVPFGLQNVVPAGAVRARIKTDHSALQGLPDYLVTNGKRLVAIDAKASAPANGKHWHHCSARSLDHLLRFSAFTQYPVLLVFSDFMSIPIQYMALKAEHITDASALRKAERRGGSGEAYYSIPCDECWRLDKALGKVFYG